MTGLTVMHETTGRSGIGEHPAVDLKSKETVRFCAILVGCIDSSAHSVADHQAADSWSREESVAAALWE